MPNSAPAAHILVADDQPDVREALRLLLKGEGYAIETVGSPAAVLAAVQHTDFDAVLLDLNYARDTTTGREGLELVSELQSLDATLPAIVMTAWGSVEKAVEAVRRGARDFIEKPWDNTRLLTTVRAQVELGRALRRSRRLEGENRLLRRDGAPEMIAESVTMRPVVQLMTRVAPSDANVLISGEHGTGKEVVAQWIHAASGRTGRPLVAVNLGGLSEGLFEREMFGHVKEAFTDARTDRIGRFELAEGGTLLLDEIGTLQPRQQAKLLRVLETGEVERVGASRSRRIDVPILSATNADLGAEVAADGFARTCCSGSTPSRSAFPRFATAGRICTPSRRISWRATRHGTGRPSPDSSPKPPWRSRPTRGRATCGSSTTPSSVRCSWPREPRCEPAISACAAPALSPVSRTCPWRRSSAC